MGTSEKPGTAALPLGPMARVISAVCGILMLWPGDLVVDFVGLAGFAVIWYVSRRGAPAY